MSKNKSIRKQFKNKSRRRATPSLSGHDQTVKFEGKFLFSLQRAVGAGFLVYRLPLNPGFLPGSGAIAASFQEFRFTGLKLKIHANTSFSQCVSYFKVNPTNTLPANLEAVYAGTASRFINIYDTEPQTLELTRGELLSSIRPWWQCASATNTGNTETDDFTQGAILIGTTSPLMTSNVNIEVAYMVEYRGPVLSGVQAPRVGGVGDVVMGEKIVLAHDESKLAVAKAQTPVVRQDKVQCCDRDGCKGNQHL